MAYVAGSRNTSISIGARLAEINTQFSEAFAAWRVYRRTMTELQNLSTRELSDLGISPSMIRSIALDAAYGPQA